MLAVTFDTLKLAQRLRDEVKFPPEQAEKAASVLADTFGDWQAQQQLATREDVRNAEVALKRDISEVEAALKRDIGQVQAEIKRLEASTKTALAETKAEIIKWVLGIAFAQSGLLLGVLKLHG